MGVWSSISLCNVDKRRISHSWNPRSSNSTVKQILNIDCNSFSSAALENVKEIRIQESPDFANADRPHSPSVANIENEETFFSPAYFEYSMGGNLKIYKKHLQQDFELEDRIYHLKGLGKRPRKTSHSDNDSEPESLRYARKPQEKVLHVENTIAEEQEAELSYDDYSTIYQPEFMLNINSQSLVEEMPKHVLEDKATGEETGDELRKDKHNISSWSVESYSPEKFENDEVCVVNKSIKSETLSIVKAKSVFTNQKDVFDYQSSSVKVIKNSKPLDNHEVKSIQHKLKECQKSKTTRIKPHKTNPGRSRETKLSVDNNTLSAKKEKSLPQKPLKDISYTHITLPPKATESKSAPKTRAIMPEKKEKTKKLIETKDFSISNDKHTPKSSDNKIIILPSAEDNLPKNDKMENNLSSLLRLDTSVLFDDVNLFEELGIADTEKLNEPVTKKDTEFYPDSPISEVSFFKTPCSTRHNSLETFEQLENECIEDNTKQEPSEKPQDDTQLTSNLILAENYKRLPKEFQEMARRLSKKGSPKKSSPPLNRDNSSQNLSCSSSTCSTISPRSPSGRKLFRTPSYKMPKTPSLSRQHPSTYVTQHTSARSRPSSRASSRATSPTREHIEAFL